MQHLTDSSDIHRIRIGDKDIILVGTAHVSAESARLVKSVIEEEQPDTVCVELCRSRFDTIRQKDRWRNMDIINVIKQKKAFLLLSNLLLAAFQKRIAEKLDVRPGQEMITAIESAEAIGARIHLADRDIRVTLSRVWRMMTVWEKAKMLFQLIMSFGQVEDISQEDIEKMKQQDMLEAILSEVEKSLPMLRTILIDERDQYLAHNIRNAPGDKIVAVVGAGHVPGIKAWLNREIDITPLNELPPKGPVSRSLKWIIPLAIVLMMIAGFFSGGARAGAHMVTWWVLANGILAGIGATLALAHPLTILSSIVAAPITSLNPMIAAGWVSGLVEAFSRKPRVADFENLPDDILSIRGFWKNKVTRVLLVVVFTNLGSSLGTFVAIPLMARAF